MCFVWREAKFIVGTVKEVECTKYDYFCLNLIKLEETTGQPDFNVVKLAK